MNIQQLKVQASVLLSTKKIGDSTKELCTAIMDLEDPDIEMSKLRIELAKLRGETEAYRRMLIRPDNNNPQISARIYHEEIKAAVEEWWSTEDTSILEDYADSLPPNGLDTELDRQLLKRCARKIQRDLNFEEKKLFRSLARELLTTWEPSDRL